MSFFREIASVLGYDEARLALGYNYVNYNGEAVYIEGVKRILRIDSDEMAFAVKGGVLYVAGESLVVQELCGASIIVRGKIAAVATSAAQAEEQKGGKA